MLLPPIAWAQGGTDFRLGVGDRVKIVVFGRSDLTNDFEIDSAGKIVMGLIGDVASAGRTLAELQSEIRTRLEKEDLADPKVSVLMVSYPPNREFRR